MAFRKGHKKIGGIKKGQVQKKTRVWKDMSEYFVTRGVERAMKIMEKAPDEVFMRYYLQFIEYFKPKMTRSDYDKHEGQDINIVIGAYDEEDNGTYIDGVKQED